MAEHFIGEIRVVPYNFAPRDWAMCDGQILNIYDNQTLYSLLGNTYGGDGRTTFGLPDLRCRTIIHSGSPRDLQTKRLGQRGGYDRIQVVNDKDANHFDIESTPFLAMNYIIALDGMYPSRS